MKLGRSRRQPVTFTAAMSCLGRLTNRSSRILGSIRRPTRQRQRDYRRQRQHYQNCPKSLHCLYQIDRRENTFCVLNFA